MIDWIYINMLLESLIDDGKAYSLKETLEKLYHEREMSPRDMEDFLYGQASAPTIRKMIKELGITPNPRGGPNYVKKRDISFLDYLCSTRKGLAEQYNVSEGYIYRHAKAMGWPVRRRRKP